MSKGNFENVEVDYVPGATPTAYFLDADGVEVKRVKLTGDTGEEAILKIFADNGFTAKEKKPDFGARPRATAENDGVKYELWVTGAKFNDAGDWAAARGGSLLVVASQAENDFVKGFLAKNRHTEPVWLGATDEAVEGQWHWQTDSNPAFFTEGGDGAGGFFTNWGANEPNNHANSEHCGVFTKDGTWNDASCSSRASVVVRIGGAEPAPVAGHDDL